MKNFWMRFVRYYFPHFWRYVVKGERLNDNGYEILNFSTRVIMEKDFIPTTMREKMLEEKLLKVPGAENLMHASILAYLRLIPLVSWEEFHCGVKE